MTGYIRLFLAIFVLLSHTGLRIKGLNPGVISVVIFYMLAGGVVAHLWNDVLPEGRGKLVLFYRDRCLRIFPLYLYVAVLTLIFLLFTSYGNPDYTIVTLLNNILIIPLNYYMVIDSTIMSEPAWNLVPPAWSLGTELQAYLLLPFVLRYHKLGNWVVVISVAIYMLANLSYINTDYFGYRLLPGVFFMFVLGSHLRGWQKNQQYKPPILICIIFMVIYLVLTQYQLSPQPYSQETLLGLIIGIPLLMIAMNLKVNFPFNRQAGSLSYGVFLSHFLVIWIIDYTQIIEPVGVSYYAVLIISSMLISWVGIKTIERRINKLRIR